MINYKENEFLFQKIYDKNPTHIFFSPGRLNLIGEHIDYNGGYVLPIAISLGTYAYVSLRDDNLICLASTKQEKRFESTIDELEYEDYSWGAYVIGSFKVLKEKGYNLKYGMNILIDSDLPISSGLSSSASLEVLAIYLAGKINDFNISSLDIALFAREAEIKYNHVMCGVMDQCAIALGVENKALLLDTNKLTYEYVDLDLEDYMIAILKTNKVRKLNESKYNERVKECNEVIKAFADCDQKLLCMYNFDDLNKIKPNIDEIHYKRAKHVISEQNRVLSLIKALNSKDLQKVGKLLIESHNSLKYDYDVTGIHLDTIVSLALKHNALGARMTGAGFGGCALAIIKNVDKEEFSKSVIKEYYEELKIIPEIFFVNASSGPKQIK